MCCFAASGAWLSACHMLVQILPPDYGGTAAWLPVDKAVVKFRIYSGVELGLNGECLHPLLPECPTWLFSLATDMHMLIWSVLLCRVLDNTNGQCWTWTLPAIYWERFLDRPPHLWCCMQFILKDAYMFYFRVSVLRNVQCLDPASRAAEHLPYVSCWGIAMLPARAAVAATM